MKCRFFSFLLAGLLCLTAGCGSSAPAPKDDKLNILATTYPIYLLTCAVTEGVDSVEVSLLVNEQVSCLHDYTLTVNDMKAIEKADIIVANGVGFEAFMSDALAQTKATVIDCSEGIELLPSTGHHDHDHGHDHGHETEGEHFDPHYWLDPSNTLFMMGTISVHLSQLLPEAEAALYTAYDTAVEKLEYARQSWKTQFQTLSGRHMITFHDGFQYFAHAYGIEILKAIEEEEGAEASAAEIKEIVSLIKEHNVSVIFVEKNGSDSTAQAIARETGVSVYALDMIMSGDGNSIQSYIDAMSTNLQTVAEALK